MLHASFYRKSETRDQLIMSGLVVCHISDRRIYEKCNLPIPSEVPKSFLQSSRKREVAVRFHMLREAKTYKIFLFQRLLFF